ncbi:hypothetical protein ALC60_02665 [Trachymyrmex zeteki]|uniref:Uncharacterized protein n=1 Tax=Mycetomoellerius zeteki TaxID=64791 RepID=A0A151XD05_9HYME|nr:hypothetical protein ALC60_02665 [Trachymyrmex zeteki]
MIRRQRHHGSSAPTHGGRDKGAAHGSFSQFRGVRPERGAVAAQGPPQLSDGGDLRRAASPCRRAHEWKLFTWRPRLAGVLPHGVCSYHEISEATSRSPYPSSFVSENVASLRRMRLDSSSHGISTVLLQLSKYFETRSVQAGYSLNIHGCATLSRALQTSLFRTGMIIEAPIDPDHSKLSLGAQTLPCAETMTVAAKERRDHAL